MTAKASHPPLGVTARATVLRVVDGDTVDVALHLPLRVRLLDCWAPETHGVERPDGEQSKAFVESLLAGSETVVVNVPTTDAQSVGDVLTFGRVLGNIYLPDLESSLSEMIVAAGFATVAKGK